MDKTAYQLVFAWTMGGAVGFVACLLLSDTKKKSNRVGTAGDTTSGGSSASEASTVESSTVSGSVA